MRSSTREREVFFVWWWLVLATTLTGLVALEAEENTGTRIEEIEHVLVNLLSDGNFGEKREERREEKRERGEGGEEEREGRAQHSPWGPAHRRIASREGGGLCEVGLIDHALFRYLICIDFILFVQRASSR